MRRAHLVSSLCYVGVVGTICIVYIFVVAMVKPPKPFVLVEPKIHDPETSQGVGELQEVLPVPFQITVNGVTTKVSKVVPYNGAFQDKKTSNEDRTQLRVSQDGTALTLLGNAAKAIDIGTYELTPYTILEFDFSIEEIGRIHAIILDGDLRGFEFYFKLGGTAVAKGATVIHPTVEAGEGTQHCVIEVGKYFIPDGPSVIFHHMAFLLDTSGSLVKVGDATFSKVQLYEQSKRETVALLRFAASDFVSFSTRQDRKASRNFMQLQVSQRGTAVTLYGNAAKVLKIPKFQLTPQTVLEFDFWVEEVAEVHGISLETKLTGHFGRFFFKLGGTQNSKADEFIIHPLMEGDEGPRRYVIELGKYFIPDGSSPIIFLYIVLFSDNDAKLDEGCSTFSNLKLYNRAVQPPSSIQNDFTNLMVNPAQSFDKNLTARTRLTFSEGDFVSYGGKQDKKVTSDFVQVKVVGAEEEEGRRAAVTLYGNAAKALNIPAFEAIPGTVLEFDFVLDQEGEIHAILLESDLFGFDQLFFKLAGTQTAKQEQIALHPPSPLKSLHHYVIEVGKYFIPDGRLLTIRNVVFFQDNDLNPDKGQSTFSNIKLYNRSPETFSGQHEEMPTNSSTVPSRSGVTDGIPVLKFSAAHFVSYAGQQDRRASPEFPQLTVSDDGTAVTLKGNAVKALSFAGTFELTPNTILEFDFILDEITELHAVLLESDLEGFDQHFKLGGIQEEFAVSIHPSAKPLEGLRHYVLEVGKYFIPDGEAIVCRHLVFQQDSDADLKVGQSTFSNIRLYNRGDSSNVELKIPTRNN